MSDADKLSVLVIDDDLLMRELLTALLEAEGQQVSTAESQNEALARLSKQPFDAVLTDLHLPDTDIHELISKVREQIAPTTALIGISGSEPGREVRALLDDFLPKPFSTDEFFEAVMRAKEPKDAIEQKTQEILEDSSTPVLDTNIYKKLLSSMPAAQVREFYKITLNDTRHRRELIQAAFEQGDLATCRAEAHAIKGGCGMVGAMELRALAASIETGATPDAATLHQIETGCERLQRMLDTLPT